MKLFRVRPFGDGQVERGGLAIFGVGAGGVEVGVVGHDVARLKGRAKQDALGGAALVGGDDVLEVSNFPYRRLEAVERPGPGVRLVALHHPGPLRRGHRPRAGVGQQVNQHIFGFKQKEIVPGRLKRRFPLCAGGVANGFDSFDAEGFDDGAKGHAISYLKIYPEVEQGLKFGCKTQ